jgi:hypothetical protein
MLSAKIFSVLATGIAAALVISSSIFTPAYAQHKVLPTVIRIAIGISLLIPSHNTGNNVLQNVLQKIITQAAPIPHITPSDGLIGHK